MLTRLDEGAWPPADVILSVRSAPKLASLGGGLKSGIHKKPHSNPILLKADGIPGDSIDYPYHGGKDKALHQYCSSHYTKWAQEKPQMAVMFKIGAFGENISSEHMNEDNVCIGDVFEIGEEVIVQVTEPRTPCYKLNARFEWPQAARRVTKTGRIGWYYRILQTGFIKEGDTISLRKRINPRWTIRNTGRVVMDKQVSLNLVKELVGIEGLGKMVQDIAQAKADGDSEDTAARTGGGAFYFTPYELTEAIMVTARVRKMTFDYRGPKDRLITDQFAAHAYVNLKFGADNIFERSYSVVSGDIDRFVLGISLDDNSRGGSRYLHQDLQIGDQIQVSKGETGRSSGYPEGFDVKSAKHLFILGGIGVTAFLREIGELMEQAAGIEIHYACRSRAEAAFQEYLPKEETIYYAKDEGCRLNIQEIISKPDKDGEFHSIVYCCGPSRLLDDVESYLSEIDYPPSLCHIESFGTVAADGSLGEAFEAIVEDVDSGCVTEVTVPCDKSLLNVLEEAGMDILSSCRAGRCGVCVVNLKGGEVMHKGTGLKEEWKQSSMLSCVSRGKGRIEIAVE